MVLGSEYFVRQIVERVVSFCSSFLGAEDQADRRVFSGFHPVLAGVVEVEVHLASVGIAELADFEVDDDEAPEPPVKEYEVDAEPVVVDPEPTLPSKKSKIIAQFQKKIGEVLNQRFFQFRFGVFILEIEKFENEWILDGLFRRDCIAGFGMVCLLQHGGFVLGKGDALVKLAANLAIELTNGPA